MKHKNDTSFVYIYFNKALELSSVQENIKKKTKQN